MNLNFDELFKSAVLFMKINRSHPDIARDRKWLVSFLIMHGLFMSLFMLLLYSIMCDVRNNDFQQACCSGIFTMVGIVITFQYCMMLLKQRELADLMKTVKEDFKEAQSLAHDDQVLLSTFAMEGRRTCWLWLALGVLTASLFPLKSLLAMLLSAIRGDFTLIPVHEMTYPPALERRKGELPVFLALYMLHLWYAFYAACMYIAMVPLGLIFLTHACGQLEVLKRRLKELFPDKGYDAEEAHKKIKHINVKMQNVYTFVHQIEEAFRLIYELCLKGCGVTLPITLYQVLETLKKGEFSLEFASFIFGCLAMIGCICYYSDLLYETGESYRQAIYESGWERHWERRTRSSVRMMLARCSEPVAMRAMLRTIRLHSLTEVVRLAYTLFNLLNTVT